MPPAATHHRSTHDHASRERAAMPTGHSTRHSGHADEGHGDGAGHGVHDHTGHAELFRRLFWWNLLLAAPVVVFSEMVQDWFG